MKQTEGEVLKLVSQSSLYYLFELSLVVSIFTLFLLVFCLAWKEFFLLLSLVRALASSCSEESAALPQSPETGVSLKEVA